MYSSLLKIDLVGTKDGQALYVQTDHRSRDEIAGEPEVSILFALTRVLNARRHAIDQGEDAPLIIYACADEPTAELAEALAAAGAVLEVKGGAERRALAPVAATSSELADTAFRGLARRVQARTGLSDLAATLHALEAETLAEPPDSEDDEIGYWTRVLELAAVTAEILRARRGGRWVEHGSADVPFGFQNDKLQIVLATNRAARFIVDGETETMFTLIETDAEFTEQTAEGPILPSLRPRHEAERENMIFRPLLERSTDPDVPVIAYGNDHPRTFGLLTRSRDEDLAELHARALVNLAEREVEVQELEVAGVDVVAVTGSFFATEKLLDQAFMRGLHRRLGAEMLAASVPRRGVMFVTNAAAKEPLRAMTVLRAMTDQEHTTTRAIATAILLVQDGNVVGQVQLTKREEAAADGVEEVEGPPKKKGFFRRLFGK